MDIEKLDAKAKPHFKAAEQNIHSVVKKITKSKNLWKLSWYMAQDKISGTDKARHFLNSYGDVQSVYMSNWYMIDYIGELKIMKPCLILSSAMLVIMMIIIVGGAVA